MLTSRHLLNHASHALCIVAIFAAMSLAAWRDDPDPEPSSEKTAEKARPSIDFDKAKTDPALARKLKVNEQKSSQNMRLFGLAIHNYHDAMSHFPDDVKDKNGKPILSWRVLLLPYLDQDALYRQFKLDEPWDSQHNLKLLDKMPEVYRSPRVLLRHKGKTVYQVFKGKNAPFGRGKLTRITDVTDGTSNTILAVETSTGVPWTKPEDVPFDRVKPVPTFGKALGDRPVIVMCDGSVRTLELNKVSEVKLKNLIDPADGNVIGED